MECNVKVRGWMMVPRPIREKIRPVVDPYLTHEIEYGKKIDLAFKHMPHPIAEEIEEQFRGDIIMEFAEEVEDNI